MKALQHVAHGEPAAAVKLVDLPDPEPGPEDIVIAMEAAALHLADIKNIRAEPGFGHQPLPRIPGYEGIGRVIKAGAKVTLYKVGDRVFPPSGSGTFAQQLCVPAADSYPAPDGDARQLALMMVNGATSVVLLEDFADLTSGDWLLQNGANSSCGRYIIALAKDRGIRTVNVVRRESVIPELQALGADRVILDAAGPDVLAQKVSEATGGAALALGLDMVSGPATTRIARCLAPGGTVVNYGFISGLPAEMNFIDLFRRNITLRGMSMSRGIRKRGPEDMKRVYDALAAKIANGSLKAAIAAAYPLGEYREAFAHALRTGAAREGKIILLPNG